MTELQKLLTELQKLLTELQSEGNEVTLGLIEDNLERLKMIDLPGYGNGIYCGNCYSINHTSNDCDDDE